MLALPSYYAKQLVLTQCQRIPLFQNSVLPQCQLTSILGRNFGPFQALLMLQSEHMIFLAANILCARICNGQDPDCLYTLDAKLLPLCRAFTEHGSTTFCQPGGGPYDVLHVPLISCAIMAQAAHGVGQILGHRGLPNIRVPETGQTPLHVLGLSMGREKAFNAKACSIQHFHMTDTSCRN